MFFSGQKFNITRLVNRKTLDSCKIGKLKLLGTRREGGRAQRRARAGGSAAEQEARSAAARAGAGRHGTREEPGERGAHAMRREETEGETGGAEQGPVGETAPAGGERTPWEEEGG